ncbi:MAG TPA: hypothetical protein VHI52_10710 [Verrucomicrobiae bacterium]|nr:hypothetical protein [Verrucomicrobiae bacterium]
MNEGDAVDWPDQLRQLIRTDSPTRHPQDPDLNKIRKGLQEVIVRHARMKQPKMGDRRDFTADVEWVLPILELFPGTSQSEQIDAMFAAVVAVAKQPAKARRFKHQSAEIWEKILYGQGTIEERMQCRTDYDERSNQRNIAGLTCRTAKEFAELLALELALEPQVGPSLSREIQSTDQVTPTINICMAYDGGQFKEIESVSFTGDIAKWHLAILRSKTDLHIMPPTNVLFRTNYGPNPVQFTGRILTNEDHRSGIEYRILNEYGMVLEDFVVEVCKLSVQYCWFPFMEMDSCLRTLAGTIGEVWSNYCEPGKLIAAQASFQDLVSISLMIPSRALQASYLIARLLTEDGSSELHAGCSLKVLAWDYLIDVGFPAIISTWLKSDKTVPIDRFFTAGSWKIVEQNAAET